MLTSQSTCLPGALLTCMLPLARDCISPGPMPGGLRVYATDSRPTPILHMLWYMH